MAAILGYTVLGIFQSASAAQNTISTVVGTGHYAGDGGPATSAILEHPTYVAVDNSGNVYVVDKWNDVVRKIETSGTITTVAGNGTDGYSGDGGQATAAQLNYPTAVAVDGSGNLYIADAGNARIREVDASTGIVTPVRWRASSVSRNTATSPMSSGCA